MKRNLVIISLCTILFMSCTNSLDRVDNSVLFFNKQELLPKRIPINEVIRPVDMVITSDYLVIQNDILDDQDQFFVYSLDSLRFLYSFVRRGHGPKEFIAPALIQNGSNNNLMVVDQASFKIITYQLRNDSAAFYCENRIETDEKQPLQEIYLCDDSVLVYSTLSNKIQTYNLNSKKIIDSFSFNSEIPKEMGANYNKSFDSFHLGYENYNINVGFHYINKISRGKIDKEYHIQLEEPVIHAEKLNESLYDNLLYYMYITMGENYTFAQFAGCSFREFQPFPLNMGKRNFKFMLEVYEPQGKVLGLINIKEDILRCKIDEKTKRIFTWNPLADFEELLVYQWTDF